MKTLIPFKVNQYNYFQVSHTHSIKYPGVLLVQYLPAISALAYHISCYKYNVITTNLFAGDFQPNLWFTEDSGGFNYQLGNQKKQLANS
jgi:hypothetical protein